MAAEDFTTPKLVGYFGRDGSAKHSKDLSLLRYMTVDFKNILPIDLTLYNVKQYVWEFEKNAFYRYILDHLDIIRQTSNDSIMNALIITKSAALDRLWYLYNNAENIQEVFFTIHLLMGKIYFLVEKSIEDGSTHEGNIFAHALKSKSPDSKEDPNETADAVENFFGVYQMQLQNHSLLYQYVIDCILANENTTRVCNDNELSTLSDLRTRDIVKCMTSIRHDSEKKFKFYKTKTIWMKGFLGNADVCVGFRSREDLVYKIKMYSQQELLDMNPYINPSDFFKKLDVVLSDIKELLIQEATKLNFSDDVHKIPKMTIRLASTKFGIFRRVDTNPRFDLPDWYVEEMTKML